MKYSEIKYKYQRIAHIKAKVGSDPQWAIKALMRIYDDQTREEQNAGHTSEHNGVGFSGIDGEILSSFAEQINKGRNMSPKQMALIHKKMPKYATQLEAAAKTAQKAEPRTVGASVNRIRHLRDMHRSHCDQVTAK